MSPRATADDAGFALIEVLAAFVVVTLSLVAAYAGIGNAYRQIAEARIRQETLTHALSHLESLGQSSPLAAGTSAGRYDDGTGWQMEIVELPAGGPATRPHLVTLTATGRGVRILGRWRTIKLAASRP